jgi:hypothetical protein
MTYVPASDREREIKDDAKEDVRRKMLHIEVFIIICFDKYYF